MRIAKYLALALALGIAPGLVRAAEPGPGAPAVRPIHYGSNPAAGGYFEHDGVKLYYEVYGQGRPLLLIGTRVSPWTAATTAGPRMRRGP